MGRIRSAAIAAILVTAGVLAGAEGAIAYQGHMFAARGDLQSARAQLNAAIPDKAGHRVNALDLVNEALGQVNAGISAGAR